MNRLKLLIVSSIVVLLPGCAIVGKLYDSYFLSKFDSTEYFLLNKIRTDSIISVSECSNTERSQKNFNSIYNSSLEFFNYTQFIPNNEDTQKIAKNILDVSKQGKELYDNNKLPSEAFCKLKLQQITRVAETAQQAIGGKPR